MEENKKEIKNMLKKLLDIFEKNNEKELDIYISDIYYLLSLYYLRIISIQKLKDESLDIMGSWFSGNSRCGLNEFHFGSEVNEETIRLNNTWSDLIKKLNIMIRNL